MADSTVRVKVDLDEEALRDRIIEILAGHAVVKPDETLVIRSANWTPNQVELYQEYLDERRLPFRVAVVAGDGFAVAKPEPEALDDPPGLPSFAVAEIEWAEGGETRRQKFGPWPIARDDSHIAAISGFVNGWSTASGFEPALVTLITGDESVAEGATRPYRESPAA